MPRFQPPQVAQSLLVTVLVGIFAGTAALLGSIGCESLGPPTDDVARGAGARQTMSWSFLPGSGARAKSDSLRLSTGRVHMTAAGKHPPAAPVCEGIVRVSDPPGETLWRTFAATLRPSADARAPGDSTWTRYFEMTGQGDPQGEIVTKTKCRYPATEKAQGRVVRAVVEMRDSLRSRFVSVE